MFISSSFRYAAIVAIFLSFLPPSEAAEPACAGVTPAETWAAAAKALSGVAIDGEMATATAGGPVKMAQIDERWYLLLPE